MVICHYENVPRSSWFTRLMVFWFIDKIQFTFFAKKSRGCQYHCRGNKLLVIDQSLKMLSAIEPNVKEKSNFCVDSGITCRSSILYVVPDISGPLEMLCREARKFTMEMVLRQISQTQYIEMEYLYLGKSIWIKHCWKEYYQCSA